MFWDHRGLLWPHSLMLQKRFCRGDNAGTPPGGSGGANVPRRPFLTVFVSQFAGGLEGDKRMDQPS